MSAADAPGAAGEFLLVLSGTRRVALTLGDLVEVVETTSCRPVPAREPALRGVMAVRERLLPLVHLGALLDGRACPPALGEAAVVVAVGTAAGSRRLCFEVDAAEAVVRAPLLPVPPEAALPWAAALARLPDGLVPLLDLPALGARLMETGSAS